ncbi:hypothetical protein PMAYCL1PPCAC_12180, partial [Pristionchus mayeri]
REDTRKRHFTAPSHTKRKMMPAHQGVPRKARDPRDSHQNGRCRPRTQQGQLRPRHARLSQEVRRSYRQDHPREAQRIGPSGVSPLLQRRHNQANARQWKQEDHRAQGCRKSNNF